MLAAETEPEPQCSTETASRVGGEKGAGSGGFGWVSFAGNAPCPFHAGSGTPSAGKGNAHKVSCALGPRYGSFDMSLAYGDEYQAAHDPRSFGEGRVAGRQLGGAEPLGGSVPRKYRRSSESPPLVPKIVVGSSSQSLLSRPTDNGAMSMEGAKEPKKKEKKNRLRPAGPPTKADPPGDFQAGSDKGRLSCFPIQGPGGGEPVRMWVQPAPLIGSGVGRRATAATGLGVERAEPTTAVVHVSLRSGAKGDACVMQMFVSEERPCVQGRAEMDLILRYVYGARMGFGLERAAGELLGCAAGLAPGVEDGPRGQIRCNNLAPLYLEVGASTRGTWGQDLPTKPRGNGPRAGHVRDTYQDRDTYHKDPRLSSPSPCPSPLRHQSDPALVKMLLVMWPHIRPEAACTDRLVSLDRAAQREGNSNWGISQQRPRHRSSSWESANRGSHSVFVIELDQEDAKPCRWREAPASLVRTLLDRVSQHWRGRRLGNEQATFSEALLRSFVLCKACSDTVHVVKRNDEAQQQEKKQQQALSSTSIITPSDALWRK
ncbi:hypothetical protein Purlil1_12751 [Purpureocillium lilacinum]|uniref:BTB domain-containing protein n=1 Tax=Purpureocillium lilacinum TaxID=33203 RepID=A0ABR0BFZ2_PURLI|nr:hypothetical protein Purlil1_12751 [Purpureocillium lilacinum]